MASELRVNTLKDASGNNSIATSFVAQGSAKVWLVTDAGAEAPDSLNVSGMTDNGTGDYTAAYTTSMANTNYSIVGISAISGSSMNQHWIGSSAYIQTGSYRMNTLFVNNTSGGGQVVDATYVSLQNMGDLA